MKDRWRWWRKREGVYGAGSLRWCNGRLCGSWIFICTRDGRVLDVPPACCRTLLRASGVDPKASKRGSLLSNEVPLNYERAVFAGAQGRLSYRQRRANRFRLFDRVERVGRHLQGQKRELLVETFKSGGKKKKRKKRAKRHRGWRVSKEVADEDKISGAKRPSMSLCWWESLAWLLKLILGSDKIQTLKKVNAFATYFSSPDSERLYLGVSWSVCSLFRLRGRSDDLMQTATWLAHRCLCFNINIKCLWALPTAPPSLNMYACTFLYCGNFWLFELQIENCCSEHKLIG